MGQVVACREVGGLPVSGVSSIQFCSLLSRFPRAGTLAVFLFVLCLLGVDDARAEGSTEIYLRKFVPGREYIQVPTLDGDGSTTVVVYSYTFNRPFAIAASFDYDGTHYTVNKVQWRGSQVDLEISPQFPPSGSHRSEFYLHLGISGTGGTLRENVKFNFGDSSAGIRNTWNGQAGWEDKVQTAYLRITGPADPNSAYNQIRFAALPEGSENHGRLEIFDPTVGEYGKWKWICDDGFGQKEAKIACRQLDLPTGGAEVWELPEDWLDVESYNSDLSLLIAAYLAQLMNTPALLDDVDCDGDESGLVYCDHAGVGVSDCTVSEAVGVTCPAEDASGDGDE